MIEPTIGRVVWFHPYKGDPDLDFSNQPLAALVVYVHSNTMINLAVFDSNGKAYNKTSVDLVQDGDKVPGAGSQYAEWMPYQREQAVRHASPDRPVA